jgi:branched-chain amino acid transport system permease protein
MSATPPSLEAAAVPEKGHHPDGRASRALVGVRGWRPSPTVIGAVLFLIAFLVALASGSSFVYYDGALVAIYAIVTVSQEWLLGRAGLVSLGAAAIMAIGAFTTARMSTLSWAVFPIPVVVALVFGCAVGLVVGIPSLRFRGLYLMLTTLALQFVITFAGQAYQGVNNEAGFTVTPPTWGSIQLTDPRTYFIICVIVLAVILLLLSGLYRGAPGRAWLAMRQNESAAAVLGVGVRRWKLAAFVGSSGLCAVGGALYAYLINQVGYTSFSLDLSLTLVVMVFIGGIGTISGPVIGAAIVVLLPLGIQQLANPLSNYQSISTWLTQNEAIIADGIYGLLLLLILLYEPAGIVGLLKHLARSLASLVGRLFRVRHGNYEATGSRP